MVTKWHISGCKAYSRYKKVQDVPGICYKSGCEGGRRERNKVVEKQRKET